MPLTRQPPSTASGDTSMFSTYSDMVTVPEIAKMLRIGRNNAYELVRAGIVPSLKIGRQIRITKQAVIDYIVSSGNNQ